MNTQYLPNRLPQSTFRKWAKDWLEAKLAPVLAEKGEQYTGDAEPALSNFEEGAAINHMPTAQYLMVMATKHWQALTKWSRNIQGHITKQEAAIVAERAKDIIIYMLLLVFWTTDSEEVQK